MLCNKLLKFLINFFVKVGTLYELNDAHQVILPLGVRQITPSEYLNLQERWLLKSSLFFFIINDKYSSISLKSSRPLGNFQYPKVLIKLWIRAPNPNNTASRTAELLKYRSAKKMYTNFNERKLRCITDYCKSTIYFRQHNNMIYVFTSI